MWEFHVQHVMAFVPQLITENSLNSSENPAAANNSDFIFYLWTSCLKYTTSQWLILENNYDFSSDAIKWQSQMFPCVRVCMWTYGRLVQYFFRRKLERSSRIGWLCRATNCSRQTWRGWHTEKYSEFICLRRKLCWPVSAEDHSDVSEHSFLNHSQILSQQTSLTLLLLCQRSNVMCVSEED